MKILLSSSKTLDHCRDINKHDLLIREILQNREIRNFVSNLITNQNILVEKDHILNDSIINFIKVGMRKEFEFSSEPMAYFKTVLKNTYFGYIRKNKIILAEIREENISTSIEPGDDRINIIDSILKLIQKDCAEILKMWAYSFKYKEMLVPLKYGSEKYLKKKKRICLKKLILSVNKNPKFKKELREYI